MTITFRGGRLRADPDRPYLELARILTPELAAPPASADWLTPVPADAWGMLGNDQLGDCTCAGVGHKRIGDAYVNQGRTLDVSTADVIRLYENFGYRPGDPSTDQGAVCQDVLAYWHQHGFLGEKIAAYARVDVKNRREVKQAIALFGQLYTGFTVVQAAEDQFNARRRWTVVPGSPELGGHCVTVGAYNSRSLKAVTWGTVQAMSWGFFEEYFEEAWVVLSPADFIDPKTGTDRAGLDLATLRADFTRLTGRSLDLAA
jgi:hypothetical protein